MKNCGRSSLEFFSTRGRGDSPSSQFRGTNFLKRFSLTEKTLNIHCIVLLSKRQALQKSYDYRKIPVIWVRPTVIWLRSVGKRQSIKWFFSSGVMINNPPDLLLKYFPKFGDFIFDLLLHNIRRTQIYDTEKPEY